MNNRRLNRISKLIVEQIIIEANASDLASYVRDYIMRKIDSVPFLKGAKRYMMSYLEKINFNPSSILADRRFDARKVAGYVRKLMSSSDIRNAKQKADYMRSQLPRHGFSQTAINNFMSVFNYL